MTPIPPTPIPTIEPPDDLHEVGIEHWLGALIISLFISWGATRSGSLFGNVKWGIRWGLSSFIGGLVFYTYFILGLPGSNIDLGVTEQWKFLLMTIIGAVLGWLLSALLIIFTRSENNR